MRRNAFGTGYQEKLARHPRVQEYGNRYDREPQRGGYYDRDPRYGARPQVDPIDELYERTDMLAKSLKEISGGLANLNSYIRGQGGLPRDTGRSDRYSRETNDRYDRTRSRVAEDDKRFSRNPARPATDRVNGINAEESTRAYSRQENVKRTEEPKKEVQVKTINKKLSIPFLNADKLSSLVEPKGLLELGDKGIVTMGGDKDMVFDADGFDAIVDNIASISENFPADGQATADGVLLTINIKDLHIGANESFIKTTFLNKELDMVDAIKRGMTETSNHKDIAFSYTVNKYLTARLIDLLTTDFPAMAEAIETSELSYADDINDLRELIKEHQGAMHSSLFDIAVNRFVDSVRKGFTKTRVHNETEGNNKIEYFINEELDVVYLDRYAFALTLDKLPLDNELRKVDYNDKTSFREVYELMRENKKDGEFYILTKDKHVYKVVTNHSDEVFIKRFLGNV